MPPAPSSLTVDERHLHTLVWAWDADPDAEWYQAELRLAGASSSLWTQPVTWGLDAPAINITGADPYTEYELRVRAIYEPAPTSNVSDWTDWNLGKTLGEDGTPPSTSLGTITDEQSPQSPSRRRVTVPVSTSPAGCGYEYRVNGGGWTDDLTAGPLVRDFDPGQSLTFEVRAYDEDFNIDHTPATGSFTTGS